MTKAVQAIAEWLGTFGVFYAEGDIPKDAALPYGTIPLKEPDWRSKTTYYIQLYDRAENSASVLETAEAIAGAIGDGKRIPFEGGIVVLRLEDPQIQCFTEGDIRRGYINLSMNSYHVPGI